MADELNLEAERAASARCEADQADFETWAKSHGGLPLDRDGDHLKTDDGLLHFPTYKFGRTEIAWRAWANKPNRPAPAAAQLDAELPPLPPATEGTVTGARRWSASRMWEYADQARAPCAERIRLLEREKAERKPATSIGDDPEFQDLAGDVYRAGSYNESIEKSLNALIAYIDGRTAGTAVPEGYALAPLEPTEAMLKSAVRAFQSAYNSDDTLADWRAAYKASIAAAPSPQENTK